MTITRRFLIPPALARLLRRDRGGTRVTEGHFPNQTGRSSHVLLDTETSSLVLVTAGPDGNPVEERTEVPRGHAEALLDVAPGKVDYARTRLNLAGREIWVDRFVTPGPLDLVVVSFENQEEAGRFTPPEWFGPEVTGDEAFHPRSVALHSLPDVPEVPLSNAALDSLLDTLENRFAGPRSFAPPRRPQGGEDVLRRMPGSPAEGTARPREAPPASPAPAPAEAAPHPASGPVPAERPAPATGTDVELDIEDDVIRELARSLRPAGRSGS